MNAHAPIQADAATDANGSVRDIPLNKLKKSEKNARKTPHGESAIEALAASIAVKGILQAPVVEPETGEDGAETGFFLVTIGEGRRLALRLLAKRKVIKKTEPVRCVIDTANDPHEISLDENVTRTDMHPADQFEAFRRLVEDRGLGAEDIGARFGVSAQVVRQRLRLGAASPKLMALYREGNLNLDQLMAFAVSDDHDRQEQVLEQIGPDRAAYLIRRTMTEAKVPAQDRRAVFLGAEAYGEAGGTILRDLFTEDGGGWFEDVALLDRMAAEKLAVVAEETREREGWKWAEAHINYPHGEGLTRVYPHRVERSEAEQADIAKLGEAYDAIVSQYDGSEEWPAEVEAHLSEIEAALNAYGDDYVYTPDEIARGGLFAILGQDGVARIERGFVRAEDLPQPGPDVDEGPEAGEEGPSIEPAPEEVEDDTGPLSERLVLDLMAQRTMALRDAVGSHAEIALTAVVHAMAAATFYPTSGRISCLEIKPTSAALGVHDVAIGESRAGRSVDARHEVWAVRLPKEAEHLWTFVAALPSSDLLDLLAHCASLTVNAVRTTFDRKPLAMAQADRLAEAVSLDMSGYWTATVESYLGRVTKARIGEAVREAVSPEAAERISGMKKPDMASEAQALLAGKGWLPSLLRAPVPPAAETTEPAPISQEAA